MARLRGLALAATHSSTRNLVIAFTRTRAEQIAG